MDFSPGCRPCPDLSMDGSLGRSPGRSPCPHVGTGLTQSKWEFGSRFGSESRSDLDTDSHPVSDPDSDRNSRALSAIAQRLVCISLQVFVRCSEVPLRTCYTRWDPVVTTFDGW